MIHWLLILLAASPALPESPSIVRTADAARDMLAEIPAMAAPADEGARRVSAGGKLWAAGQPSVVSELAGRAAGLMLCKPLGSTVPASGDCVIYAADKGGGVPQELNVSGAYVIALGANAPPQHGVLLSSPAPMRSISPTLENAIVGWTFMGELVAAFTRLGKMPVIYETIGLYNGVPRINAFDAKGIYFHDKHDVKPISAGVIGAQFVTTITGILARVQTEDRAKLDQAAAWAADAKTGGKRVVMYCMGHLFPDEISKTAIGGLFDSAVWNSGFTNAPPPNDAYSPGDALIHIGYQHPPSILLTRAKKAGARVAYVDILQDRDFTQDPNVIWIDPMWNWADGCVPIENYEVPILPASGIVNSAIAWDIYESTVRRLGIIK